MHQIDSSTAVPSRPADTAAGTAGYFQKSVPGVSLATEFTADWHNCLQTEMINLLLLGDGEGVGSETATKGTDNQIKTQIEKYVNAIAGASSGSANTEDVVQNGHGFNKYDAIQHDGATFVKSQGDSPANAAVVGIVSEVTDVNNFTVTYGGLVAWNAPGVPDYTLGEDIWLSTTILGNITATPISYVKGDVRQYVGESLPGGLLVNIDLGDEVDNIPSVSDPVSGTWGGLSPKTVNYQVLDADNGDMVYLTLGATAERVFTLKGSPDDKDLIWIANSNATYRLTVSDGVDDVIQLFEGESKKFTYSSVLSKWLTAEA
tara:strand:+ start:2646 stop:3599 length:954 start_codon:yes stop_codon:yes gene_type:complete